MTAYLGLLAISFLAATFLPAQSEVALLTLAASEKYSVAALLFVASLGNILGSTVNWALGRYAMRFKTQRWFPITPDQLDKLQAIYKRFGRWTLLASWVPFIGDPLTAVAGVLKEPLWSFLIIVAIAKIGRYVAILSFLKFL